MGSLQICFKGLGEECVRENMDPLNKILYDKRIGCWKRVGSWWTWLIGNCWWEARSERYLKSMYKWGLEKGGGICEDWTRVSSAETQSQNIGHGCTVIGYVEIRSMSVGGEHLVREACEVRGKNKLY